MKQHLVVFVKTGEENSSINKAMVIDYLQTNCAFVLFEAGDQSTAMQYAEITKGRGVPVIVEAEVYKLQLEPPTW